MSRLERDGNQPTESPGDATRDVPVPAAPISDADESIAHIAALVRRTTDGRGAAGSSAAAGSEASVAPPTPPTAPQVTAPHVTTPPETAPQATARQTAAQPMTATQVAHSEAAPPAEDEMPPSRPQPSRRTLVTGGILVLLLIAGGVALADPFGPDDAPPQASSPAKTAAAGYAVKVTDVTTDCAGHSRGRTKASFEAENCVKATRLLATGEVGGRPVLYVVSRIEMASAEAAASVKQVLDGNGTGNINDLLRDGKTYAGAPAEMPISGYASLQEGTVVTVAEAGFIDEGRSSSEDPALRSAAARAAGTVARG